ncbi:MAG: hypothetical protein JXQ76_02010 [Campylobacterales bacterium]|nr:hypothetical protein [Campylobacterales bacterium]
MGIFGFTYLVSQLKIIKNPDTLTRQEILAVGFWEYYRLFCKESFQDLKSLSTF